jgi:hypothetical protein
VTHAFNPSYSGGRDQEDHNSQPALANTSGDPNLKKPIAKNRAGGLAQEVRVLPNNNGHLSSNPGAAPSITRLNKHALEMNQTLLTKLTK